MITVWFCYNPRDPGQAAGGDHTLSMDFWPGSFFALLRINDIQKTTGPFCSKSDQKLLGRDVVNGVGGNPES